MATAMELAMAQMYADLGTTRFDEIAMTDADAKGQRLSPAEDLARERKIQQHLRDWEQKLDALGDSLDGQAIKGWIALSRTEEGDTKNSSIRWNGQGHRVSTRREDDDPDFVHNVEQYGEERAIYMSQKKTITPRRQEHAVAGPSTATNHRRAQSPGKQGKTVFVKDKVVSGRNNHIPPTAPKRMLAAQSAPRQAAASPLKNVVRPKGPTPVHARATKASKTTQPPKELVAAPVQNAVEPKIRMFTTNLAVKEGPLPSELLARLLADMTKSRKALKISQHLRRGSDASSVDSSVPILVYMAPLFSTSDTLAAVEEVNNCETWLTVLKLKEYCQISRAKVLDTISFSFDNKREDWLENNKDLAVHASYIGACLRREMMILAQLPVKHARNRHFVCEVSFLPQLKERMYAARAAIAAVETEDKKAKKWFETNDQYQAFYKIAVLLAKSSRNFYPASTPAGPVGSNDQTTPKSSVKLSGSSRRSADPHGHSTQTTPKFAVELSSVSDSPAKKTYAVKAPSSADTAAATCQTSGCMETCNDAIVDACPQQPVMVTHSLMTSMWAVQPVEDQSKVRSTASSTHGTTSGTVLGSLDGGKPASTTAQQTVRETPIKSALLMRQNSTAMRAAVTEHADRIKKNGIWYPRSVLAEK